jgi:hypothetical protein
MLGRHKDYKQTGSQAARMSDKQAGRQTDDQVRGKYIDTDRKVQKQRDTAFKLKVH